MSPKRGGVSPMLEEDEPQRILGVAMDRVKKASRLPTGALYVLQARRKDTLDTVGPGSDEARDDEHAPTLRRHGCEHFDALRWRRLGNPSRSRTRADDEIPLRVYRRALARVVRARRSVRG
jgi:hypothetical protein